METFNSLKCIAKEIEPIVVCGSIILGIIKSMAKYWYAYKCEYLYNISKQYFGLDIFSKLFEGMSIFIIGVINYYFFFLNVLPKNNCLNLFFTFVIVFISLMLLLIAFFDNYSRISYFIDDIVNVKNYMIITFTFAFLLTISKLICIPLYKLLFLIYFIYFVVAVFHSFLVGIKYKWNYEVVTVENKEYVVLSHYVNKLLCVNYSFSETETKNSLNLITNEYYLLSNDCLIVIKRNFKKSKKFELKVNGVPTK